MDNTGQTEKPDISGIYTDKQGTSDVYRELVLALQEDGTYAAEIGIYRATELKGTEVWEGDTLRFTSDDSYPYVLADISVTGSQAEVALRRRMSLVFRLVMFIPSLTAHRTNL